MYQVFFVSSAGRLHKVRHRRSPPRLVSYRTLQRTLAVTGIAALAACGAPSATTPSTATIVPEPLVVEDTVVSFLGTLHNTHLGNGYPLTIIEQTVRNFDPDLVLVELPPPDFESALAASDARSDDASEAPDHAWLRNKPELYDVVLPLRTTLNYEVLPVSGWTAEARADRDAYYMVNPHGPMERRYIMANAAFHAAFLEHEGFSNPAWLHGEAYLEGLTAASRWLSFYAEEDMGRGGELLIQSRHARLIEDAIRAFPGRRILVVFDATARWYLEPVVQSMDVRWTSITQFLPATTR